MVARRTGWPLLVANAALIMVVVAACRSKPVVVEQSAEPTEIANEDEGEDGEDDERPNTIEVTRIVIETALVEVDVTATPSPAEPTPSQLEPKELVVCLTNEPESLYPYSSARPSLAATHVQHAVYEPLYTTLTYNYQPLGLEKIPSLTDGDASIRMVEVQEGDTVYDVNDDVVRLRQGVKVRDSEGMEVFFDGAPILMPQMVVEFTLKPMIWSDGQPVTADDSVYSFELAANPQTPVPKHAVERTASYAATGELSLEWISVPGYLDKTYFTNIWPPLPRHYWGQYTPAELLQAEAAVSQPLSHGPFVVEEWVQGDHMTLIANENYYLADEGLPKVDTLRFNFVPNSSQLVAQLLSGRCQIGTQDSLALSQAAELIEAEQSDLLIPHFRAGTVFEHIDFGINPVEKEQPDRPDWFEDVRVRQAFVLCTDRQRMVDEILFGRGEVVHAYVPSYHPLYPADASEWPYDVDEANRLLDNARYRDTDEDGIREDPRLGGPFRVTLLAEVGNDLVERVAEIFQENLARCGVEVELNFLHGHEYFADGPEGPLFGRMFDLGAFPWLISVEPNCRLYHSSRIPGPQNGWHRNYNNEIGFRNAEFDVACEQALATLPGMSGHEAGHTEALRIWSEELPSIPLFMRLKVAATRPEVLNFELDSTQESELWNIARLDLSR